MGAEFICEECGKRAPGRKLPVLLHWIPPEGWHMNIKVNNCITYCSTDCFRQAECAVGDRRLREAG